jgi:hypothetical protein
MSKLFNKLKAGLQDAIAHKQRKLNLRSETIVLPEPPVSYKAKEIKKQKSTFDQFVEKLNPKEKREFDQEYKDLLLSELMLAAMAQLGKK